MPSVLKATFRDEALIKHETTRKRPTPTLLSFMEDVLIQLCIICPCVFLAGCIDAIAGGGGLISLPAYLFAGLPPHIALGTNKMSSSLGTALATFRFARSGFIAWRIAAIAIVGALAGGSLGASLALLIPESLFMIIMVVILPIVAFYVLRPKSLEAERTPFSTAKTSALCVIIAFFVGIYDGLYGPGTGTFLILLLTGVAHLSLTHANGVTKAINLSTNISALTVFILNGQVLFLIGITAGAFSIAGNYLGTKIFTSYGAKFVRPVMVVVLVIFFLKLVFDLVGSWA